VVGLPRYDLLSKMGDEAASAYGNKLVDGALKDEAETLNQFAWSIIRPDTKHDTARQDKKLALKAAIRADELTHGENGPILDTLALAYFEAGDPAKALMVQEKAVKSMGDNAGVKERLETYRKAVGPQKP